MNIEKAIRTAVDTGRVYLGERETLKALRSGEIRLAVVASNCPEDLREDMDRYSELSEVPVYEFKGSSMELGAVCGKPHVVSMLGVVKPGDSDIFELGRR